jgi:peptidyl-prolyl cis-trans isomerase SurA
MIRLMRRRVFGFCLMLLAGFNGAGISYAATADVDEVDHIVAIVDDDVVVRSELNGELGRLLVQLKEKGSKLPPRAILERQVLERLIHTKLQLAAASRMGITVSEQILARAVGNIARENGMTVGQLRDTLEEGGVSYKGFREGIRTQLLKQQLLDREVKRKIQVSDREVEAYLTRQQGKESRRAAYHLLHILVATPEGSSPDKLAEAKRKAERILAELRDGADFRTTALTASDGQQALEGGDLGWRKSGQLPTLFADVVSDMQKGEISEPIRSASGFHIIKLEEFKGTERHVITQTQARHILIRTNEITSDDDARIRLEQLKQRLEGGDDFATLARSHSDDQASAIKGGEIGWVSPGALVPEFEEEMNALSENQLSAPFKTQFGWHIVQVLGRRQHDSTVEVKKAGAREVIIKRKMVEESELYLRRLRDEAYVELRLNDL